jgi:hypothetical protein
VRLLCLLLDLRTGRPRSITEVSDIFLLCECEAIGSRLSTLGEARPKALDGDPALKGFEIAERGVGNAALELGDRRDSRALRGVVPPDVIEAGVISCVLLVFGLRTRGAGEPLRSRAGDLGGTSGRISTPSVMLVVSTFKAGLAWLGLRMGERGLPIGAEASSLMRLESSDVAAVAAFCSDGIYEGPVTQAMRASPKGPVLQLVPGALLDLSWPKASAEGFRRGGRPGIVAIAGCELFAEAN